MKRGEIKGVVIRPLKKICDNRGCVYHMLRRDDPLFEKFGEIYFSMVYPGVIKGWHLHKEMTLNYAVIVGLVKLALYDERKDSSTYGNLFEFLTGEDNYYLIKIPCGIWNGFKGMSEKPAIVANCATMAHDPDEIIRIDPYSDKIGYDWE
jgi:dTDP-4-dehydrorhamnose 3,5-epimerase